MADRYRGYGAPPSYDRDPRGAYPDYFPPDGSLASYYASRPYVLPGGPDVLRNNVALQPRAYGLDGPAEVINPALTGMSGLPAVARARGPSPLEDPSLAGLSGLAPARALGPSHLEEPAVVGRSPSLGKGAGISDVERHSPLPNLDGPSEDESNILFVDCLPTDCTRREVAHLFRLFDGFKDIRLVHKEPRRREQRKEKEKNEGMSRTPNARGSGAYYRPKILSARYYPQHGKWQYPRLDK
ncbi:unnamed protein product [Urochloa decumbens]|uniref:RRM domain-containing protein n=1 Tax=Urochloa decumbens TaxID=240449 RepID=A0ABC9E5U8_9POAL